MLDKDDWPEIRQMVIDNSPSRERASSLLKAAELVEIDETSITLAFPNALMKAGADRSYIDLLKDAIFSVTEVDMAINTVVEQGLMDKIGQQPDEAEETESFSTLKEDPSFSNPQPSHFIQDERDTVYQNQFPHRQIETDVPLPIYTKRMTFDTFVPGDSNQFAYSAAIAVSEAPGERYNPLFIWGKSGLGKTHLLMAITDYVTRLYRHKTAHYFQSKELTKDLADATLRNEWGLFERKYSSSDLILIDDIQFFQGKKESMERFFQLFNDFTDEKKQVVISADRSPRQIDMDERMTSRFSQGLVVDVQPPTFEMKFNIIKQYLSREIPNVAIGDDVATYVAEISGSNIREIEGALHKLESYYSIANRPITVEVATQVLHNFFPDKNSKKVTVPIIQKEVERYFGISHEEMISSKRDRRINIPRQIAMYLSHELTSESYPSIGRKFGNRDHSTIMHGAGKIQKEMKVNRDLYDKIETLRQSIKEKA